MPREVQLQVFKRSFSTKGEGCGLGSYSVNLLTQRYIQGWVWFTSDEAEGTTFRMWVPLQPPEYVPFLQPKPAATPRVAPAPPSCTGAG